MQAKIQFPGGWVKPSGFKINDNIAIRSSTTRYRGVVLTFSKCDTFEAKPRQNGSALHARD